MGLLNAGSVGWCLRWPSTDSGAVHRQVGYKWHAAAPWFQPVVQETAAKSGQAPLHQYSRDSCSPHRAQPSKGKGYRRSDECHSSCCLTFREG